MSFVLKMAWRDSRASRRRLALFSLSIALGVAALVAIGSFRDNLRQAVADQSKTLLGADLAVTSRQKLTAEARAFLDGLGGEQARETAFSSMIVFPTRGGQTRIVQVRALEGGFPFYGEAVTAPAEALRQLARASSAVVEDTLLAQFGLKVGDPVRVGEATFTIAGALEKIPGRIARGGDAGAARLHPAARAGADAPRAAGQPGALPGLLQIPARFDVEALVRDLRERFREQQLGFDTVEQRKRDLGRALDNVESFLSLVGFIALFLGAIGVASAMHVYVQQKMATIAVLRCLGATARRSFAIYLCRGWDSACSARGWARRSGSPCSWCCRRFSGAFCRSMRGCSSRGGRWPAAWAPGWSSACCSPCCRCCRSGGCRRCGRCARVLAKTRRRAIRCAGRCTA